MKEAEKNAEFPRPTPVVMSPELMKKLKAEASSVSMGVTDRDSNFIVKYTDNPIGVVSLIVVAFVVALTVGGFDWTNP